MSRSVAPRRGSWSRVNGTLRAQALRQLEQDSASFSIDKSAVLRSGPALPNISFTAGVWQYDSRGADIAARFPERPGLRFFGGCVVCLGLTVQRSDAGIAHGWRAAA